MWRDNYKKTIAYDTTIEIVLLFSLCQQEKGQKISDSLKIASKHQMETLELCVIRITHL